MSYSFPNYIIGTTDTVDVIADISCCHSGARLTAVNMQGIQVCWKFDKKKLGPVLYCYYKLILFQTDLLCEEGRNGSQRLTGRGLAMTSVVTSFILLVTSSSVLANVS